MNVADNDIGVEETRALANSPYLTNLNLRDNDSIGDEGKRTIKNSRYLRKLTSLNL